MTISNTTNKVVLQGDGLTTAFAFSFPASPLTASSFELTYFDADGVAVLVDAADYTLALTAALTGALWGLGGTVTYTLDGAAIATGTQLVLRRVLALTQPTTITNQAAFYQQVVERALDRLTLIAQQIAEAQGRALSVALLDDEPEPLPPAAERASRFLAFDADGNPIAADALDTGIPASAFATVMLGLNSAALWLTQLGFTAFSQSLVPLGTAALYRAALSVPALADLRNFLGGFTCVNNAGDATNDIDFGAGACADSSNALLIVATATMTKRLDAAWAAGTNQGGLFTGAKAANTTYHCFAIHKDSDGSVDFGFDTSVTAANKPAGYSTFRRIWSIRTDGASAILLFVQDGDSCLLKTPVLDFSGAAVSAVWTALALSVPLGIRVQAFGLVQNGGGGANGCGYFNLRGDTATDTDPAGDTGTAISAPVAGTADRVSTPWGPVLCNTSRQVAYYTAATVPVLYIRTRGWIDGRGR